MQMPSLQPEQARFLLESFFLPALQNEHRITTSVINAIPDGKGDYRPDNVSKSAIDLAWHIVTAEKRFLEAVIGGEFNISPMPRPDSVRNAADVTKWYSENFNSSLEKLKAVSNEQLTKIVDFRGMVQLPAVNYLAFLLHHSVHHRGQLTMYLRPIGAKVPSIYGESYDSALARQSQLTPA